ncbi:uncharacterized protein [Aegilops tauschii subsp. strangulata]|uniref:uncharacterized protein n=1 Tax=Aegilops tauschii subsp. strangulata TaxID=200361 RepID=UPI003CC83EE0
MPFGLKNAGSTFAREVQIGFESQLHRNIQAYMDDIVLKTKDRMTLIQDLEDTFANLRRINLKTNPEKCVFGVPSGKLLGFFVSHRGIEPNPDKIKAIKQIQAPKTVKDVRCLTGCVAAQSSAALVAQQEVDEAAAATIIPSGEEIKPIQAKSGAVQGKGEQGSRDSSKITVRKKVVQRPVYFVSSLLQRARSSFGLKFGSTTIQSRALAELIAEWMPTPDEEVLETVIPGAGVLLIAPTGEHLKYVVQMHFPWEKATNNTAEYEGLLAGLRIAIELGIKKLIIRGDSQLVVRQVNKDYQSQLMKTYVKEVRKLEERFDGLQTEHVPRAENSIADHLSKWVAKKLPVEPGTFVLHLTQPSMSLATMARKRRKLDFGKPLLAEPPEAPGRELGGNNSPLIGEKHPPAKLPILVVEACTPVNEDVPLVLVVEPQAPSWA